MSRLEHDGKRDGTVTNEQDYQGLTQTILEGAGDACWPMAEILMVGKPIAKQSLIRSRTQEHNSCPLAIPSADGERDVMQVRGTRLIRGITATIIFELGTTQISGRSFEQIYHHSRAITTASFLDLCLERNMLEMMQGAASPILRT